MLMMKTLGLVQSWCFLCRGSRLAEGLATAIDRNEASSATWHEKVRRRIVRQLEKSYRYRFYAYVPAPLSRESSRGRGDGPEQGL